jgi:heme/copper-type cytochrome/quinol oxidase subunit 4
VGVKSASGEGYYALYSYDSIFGTCFRVLVHLFLFLKFLSKSYQRLRFVSFWCSYLDCEIFLISFYV